MIGIEILSILGTLIKLKLCTKFFLLKPKQSEDATYITINLEKRNEESNKDKTNESNVELPNEETHEKEPNVEEKYGDTNIDETNGESDIERTNENETIELDRDFLKEHMDPDSGLLDALLANKTLSREEISEVKDKRSSYKRNSQLLDYIFKKNQYNGLIAALQDSEQKHIVNYLNANGGECLL